MKTMTIWTWGFRPFVMGGDVHYILKTVAPVVRRFKYRGFPLACIEGPAGRFRIAECTTGAIVTDAFASVDTACRAVLKDMRGASKTVIQKQLDDAKYQVKSRGNVTEPATRFWSMLPK